MLSDTVHNPKEALNKPLSDTKEARRVCHKVNAKKPIICRKRGLYAMVSLMNGLSLFAGRYRCPMLLDSGHFLGIYRVQQLVCVRTSTNSNEEKRVGGKIWCFVPFFVSGTQHRS